MKRILLLLVVAFILSACEDSSDADAGNPSVGNEDEVGESYCQTMDKGYENHIKKDNPSASLNHNTWIGDLPIMV